MSRSKLWMTLWIVPKALLIGALVIAVAGPFWISALAAVLGLASTLAVGQVLRPTRVVPHLTPDDIATIREERDTEGEVAAVRAMRQRHPDLSMRDAVHLVRSA